MSILAEICDRKRAHVAQKKAEMPLEDVMRAAAAMPSPAGFIHRLRGYTGAAIIAEIKKASPSGGIIRHDFDAPAIARAYQQAGACCLSVLTDIPYFQGDDSYLHAVKKAVSLPVLRKDFMIDPYQIYESRALGADCILLIMAALDDRLAAELYALSAELGMDVLVEVHDAQELERALALKPAMIGINNRNLKTLAVDVGVSHTLVKQIPAGILKISESGIAERETLLALKAAGFEGFLIGESLMKQQDIAAALASLL